MTDSLGVLIWAGIAAHQSLHANRDINVRDSVGCGVVGCAVSCSKLLIYCFYHYFFINLDDSRRCCDCYISLCNRCRVFPGGSDAMAGSGFRELSIGCIECSQATVGLNNQEISQNFLY